jgi:hypothetical protein
MLDFHTIIGNTVLSVEVDENQRRSYNSACEELRYEVEKNEDLLEQVHLFYDGSN